MKKHTPIYESAKKLNAEFIEQDGWLVAQKYGNAAVDKRDIFKSVALCDQSDNGKIRVEGKTAGVVLGADELAINEGKVVDWGQVYRLRQDLFILCSVESVAETAVSLSKIASDSSDLITVTDVTHGHSELWLIGPKGGAMLSRICGLDFYDGQFPNGAAKQSSAAKTNQLIVRRDLDEVLVYILIGPRSLGSYLWKTIMEVGQDLGIRPVAKTVLNEWL